jgi:hypothetical protein
LLRALGTELVADHQADIGNAAQGGDELGLMVMFGAS